jgi:UDP:flavonoid glycosyltransferase YjiC (YdhE family)
VATLGSLGDVFPLLALALELRARGHRVRLATTSNHEALVRGAGVDFLELRAPEDRRQALFDPRARRRSRRNVARFVRPTFDLVARYRTPGDTVVVGTHRTLGARVARDALGIPFVSVHLQPAVIRSVYDSPGLPLADLSAGHGPVARSLRRLQFALADRLYSRPIVEPALNGLLSELGRPPVRRPLQAWVHSPDLVIGLFAEWFAAPQSDWPRNTHLTGFPLVDGPTSGELSRDLEAFLRAGAPPVAFTFGTGLVRRDRLLRESAAACQEGRWRGVLAANHPSQVPAPLPDGVHHVDHVPFRLLLPRCRALVHHGGIGTSAMALAAGIPQLVVPLAFDQPDNAARLQRLGVARVLSPRSYRASTVVASLRRLTGADDVARSCAECAERMSLANALPRTCELIEDLMSGGARRGRAGAVNGPGDRASAT